MDLYRLSDYDVLPYVLEDFGLDFRQVCKMFSASIEMTTTHIRINCPIATDVIALNNFLKKLRHLESLSAPRYAEGSPFFCSFPFSLVLEFYLLFACFRCSKFQLSVMAIKQLRHLNLSSICDVTDLGPLKACQFLESLVITRFKGTNINALQSSNNTMISLEINHCPNLIDIGVLKTFTKLDALDFQQNQALSDFAVSTTIAKLDMSFCKVTDISPLAQCTNIIALVLRLTCSKCIDISPLWRHY